MCGQRSRSILLVVALVLLSVPPLYSESPKEIILNSLEECKINLILIQQQISNSQKTIQDLQNLIDDLQQQLQNSKQENEQMLLQLQLSNEASQNEINNIKQQLEQSRILLQQQLQDLEKQTRLSKELSTQLAQLNLSYTLCRNSAWIFGGISIILGGYIVGDKVLNWW